MGNKRPSTWQLQKLLLLKTEEDNKILVLNIAQVALLINGEKPFSGLKSKYISRIYSMGRLISTKIRGG